MLQSTSAFVAHLRGLSLPALVLVVVSFTILGLVSSYILGRVLRKGIARYRYRRARAHHTYIFTDAEHEPKLSRAGSLAVSLRRYASTTKSKSASLSNRLSTRIPAHWPRAETPLASPFLPATGDLGGLITPFTLTHDDALYAPMITGDKKRRDEAYTAFPDPRRGDWVVVQLPELAAVP